MISTRTGILRSVIGVVALLFAMDAHAAPIVVFNNSFESGAFVNDGNETMVLGVGSSVISGWTVINDELAWIVTPNPWGLSAQDGSRFLDLTAYPAGPPFGGVQQSLTTTPGNQYSVNYFLGSYTARWGGPPVSVQASAAGQSQTCSVTTPTASSTWMLCTMSFIAASSNTTLGFVGTAGFEYIGLDNVTVEDLGPPSVLPIPEPASMLLMGTGLAGLWMRRRARS